jgi:transcriptional regulator with XRE-family HTH domain
MSSDFTGSRLRDLRVRARLSQLKVVELTGIAESTLCYLEHGKRKAQAGTLEKLIGLYVQKIRYWDAISRELEVNHVGTVNSQRTFGNGSNGVHAGEGQGTVNPSRPLRTPQELSRV